MSDIGNWFSLSDNSAVVDFFAKKPVNENVEDEYVSKLVKHAESEYYQSIFQQFEENEGQKRTLKPLLIICVVTLCFIQLVFLNLIIAAVIASCVCGKDGVWFIGQMRPDVLSLVSSLLKFYISATVVELLGMIYFIVSNVFGNDVFDIIMEKRSKKKKKDKSNDKEE